MRFIFLARGFRTGKRVVVLCGRAEQRSKPISSWKLGSQFSQPLQQPACRLFCSLALRECFFLPTREWKTLVEKVENVVHYLSVRKTPKIYSSAIHSRSRWFVWIYRVLRWPRLHENLWLIRWRLEPPGAIFGKIETMDMMHLYIFRLFLRIRTN